MPDETARVARAVFPRGNPYLQLRDVLGSIYSDEDFADLFPRRGQSAGAPWRLALVTVLQFAEGLSDRQAAEAVRSRIVAPALSTVEWLGWETRRRAQRLVFARLTAGLSGAQCLALDALLVTPSGSGRGTRAGPLTDLRQPPRRPAPTTLLHTVARLQRIRALGLDPAVARRVHQNRLRRLAREGARYSPYFLQRFAPERRYATLVAFLLEAEATLTDQALELHDGVRVATEPGCTLSPFGRAETPSIGGTGDRLRGFPRAHAPGGLPPVLGRFHR